ncbi:radical SAM protein, partial [bacterium]|nr:radical SAM protein [bacterium]MBU1917719.1 radical SAM protein [bacterium]
NIEQENYPIEDIPMPDLSDFKAEDYLFARKPMAFMVTSRGCPHRCSFCSVHATFGYKYRKRAVDDIMQEIQMRYDQGFRVINFEDDNLTYDKDAMKALCYRITDQFADTDIEFLAMNGLSYMSLNNEILELMRKAHFTHLNVSLVTTDKDVKKRHQRPHTLTKYIDIITKAADLNFKILSSQILGLPDEPLDSMIDTLKVAAQLPVLIGASMFYLTPHSPIAKEMKHYPTDEDIVRSRLSAMAIETQHVSRDDLYTLFISTRILDFIKSLPVDQFEDRVTIQDVIKGNKLLTPYDDRTKIGLELLGDLINDGVLYAATKQGKKPLQRFKIDLFNRIWVHLEKITTQNQLTIYKEA